MVVLCCIVVVTGFLPFPVSRSSLSSPPSQVLFITHFGTFLVHQPVKCRFLRLFSVFLSFSFSTPTKNLRKTPTRPGGCTGLGSNWSRFIRALRIEECGGLVLHKQKRYTATGDGFLKHILRKTHESTYIYVYISFMYTYYCNMTYY